MRNLNRIIFINSANIPYADDIYLDGNVHFIGTQGVGKSTVLRSILFFYNADTQKLGIPVEKQSYTEYYFPYANSYIVYEVTRDDGHFCILSFRSMNRVSYRFIDSPYRKEFFIDSETLTAFTGADRIRMQLDAFGVDYSRIIYTFDEYRDILYGNGIAPEMCKYSLMESKQYQNIPRTIQNVLLNSKLDAGFIKQTIISSISEEDAVIDLNSYKEHLKNFEVRLRDIEEFQRKETQKQVREITSLSAQVSRQQAAIAKGCRELAAAFRRAQEALPVWNGKKQQMESERNGLIGRKQERQEQARLRCGTLQEELAVLENELKKARGKEQEYARVQIDRIMERSVRKDEWKGKRESLLEEQRILTSHYTEISAKYKLLIQNLDVQWNKVHKARMEQLDTLNEAFNTRMEEARRHHEEETERVYRRYERLSEELHPQRSEKQRALAEVDFRMQLCRKEAFFEAEQGEIKQRIQAYTGVHLDKKGKIGNARLVIKEAMLKWEEELSRGEKEKNEAIALMGKEAQRLKTRCDELDTFLANSRNTLQGWLKDHKPDWEENIGKLCDEAILWQTGLSPRIVDEGKSFYGIGLDMERIERPIRSISDYQREKEAADKRLEEIAAETLRLQTEKEQLADMLKYKYQPRIREQKDIISLQEYELEKLEKQYQQDMLDLESWQKTAEDRRNAQLRGLEEQQNLLRTELEEVEEKLGGLGREKAEKLDALKQEWEACRQNLANEKQAAAETIEAREKEEHGRIAALKAEYENNMQRELHTQGADTERLQDIARQLADIDRELQFIGEHAALIIEYQKDKRDLIDHVDEWERHCEEKKRLLDAEKASLRKETDTLQAQIEKLDREGQETGNRVKLLEADLEAFGKITAYDWYKPYRDIFADGPETAADIPAGKSCVELIDELGRMENLCSQLQSRLRKEVNLFTGHFGEDNTFKFKTKFNEDWEYVRFAEELRDFAEENKISEFVRRINNEHSDIFKRISMDTSMLTASEGDIHNLIKQVNKGFETCNFVGVIQCIEMKVEESSNRVVDCLRAIRKYYDSHAYDLVPGTNLFSSENEQLVKQEAIGLLRDFIKEIHAYRYDCIRLCDSFELRFRIVENNNDTGFVEKLSNVGSEGTDILVKAMINIMLLNVFKESASQKSGNFKLHCMMDEIGKLHPSNVNGILKFANDRNIILINGSPTELNRGAYKHVYLLTKGAQSKTRIARLISDRKL